MPGATTKNAALPVAAVDLRMVTTRSRAPRAGSTPPRWPASANASSPTSIPTATHPARTRNHPRTAGPYRRNADALIEAMTRNLDDGDLPTRGGQRPHLVLTMGLNDLIDSLGSALLDTGGRLSATEARRLACDCGVVPMVVGDSIPLDVGRQQRLATTALREALAQRDQGCAFPACTRSPRYCYAHHIRSWLDFGDTALHNMCLLCEYHHTIVHRQGWHIKLNARHPEFIPPATVSPTRQPLHDPLRQ
ncbi:MAG: DUF222 domain-containing protein [Pseudonocardiaceae bacterium]